MRADRGTSLVVGVLGVIAFLGGWSVPPTDAQTATEKPRFVVSGRLQLVERGRPSNDRSLDRTHGVIWFVPDVKEAPPEPVAAEMTTVRKQFSPQVLVVPVGSTVRFPNQDPILHNVFSVSGGNSFDLGLVGKGDGKSTMFRESGVVRVFCNVHHSMFAHVAVVPTSYFAVPDANGRFTLRDLPRGGGTLHFWHERGEAGKRRISIPGPGSVELSVEVTQPQLPPHTNKFGRSYRRGAYGR